jgi:putative peptidoglycan lipid II flippase
MQPRPSRRAAIFAMQVAANSLFGYLFTRCLAYQYGVSAFKDVFDIAYAIPFLILRLCGFTLIHGATVTTFTLLRQKNSDRQISSAYSSLLIILASTTISIATAALIFADPILSLLAPGVSPAGRAEMCSLLFFMSPLTLSFCVGTFLSGILIAYDVPLSSELPQILSRLTALTALFSFPDTVSVTALAVLLNIGAVIAVILQLRALRRLTPIRFHAELNLRNSVIPSILSQLPTVFVMMFCAQVAFLTMQRLASLNGPGSIATVSYALGIASPLALLLGKPLALVYGPRLTSSCIPERRPGFTRLLKKIILLVGGLSLPFCLVFTFSAPTCIGLLYGGGAFDAAAVTRTGNVSTITVWGTPAAAVAMIVHPVLLTAVKTPAYSLGMSSGYIAHTCLSFVLFPSHGLEGLAWAYLAGVCLQAVVSVLLIHNLNQTASPTPAADFLPVPAAQQG